MKLLAQRILTYRHKKRQFSDVIVANASCPTGTMSIFKYMYI